MESNSQNMGRNSVLQIHTIRAQHVSSNTACQVLTPDRAQNVSTHVDLTVNNQNTKCQHADCQHAIIG